MSTPPYIDPPTERIPRVAPRPAGPPPGQQYAYGPPAGYPQVPQQRQQHATNAPASLPAAPKSKRPLLAGGVLAAIAVAGLLVVFLIDGGSSSTSAASQPGSVAWVPSVAPTTTAPYRAPAVSSLSLVEQAFIRTLDQEDILPSATDQERLKIGRLVCDTFDEGDSFTRTARTLQTSGVGMSEYDAGFLVGVSVTAFCPEHTSKIR